MEQNRELRNGPLSLWSTNLGQSRKECPMEQKIVIPINGVGNTGQPQARRIKLDHLLTPHTKIRFKMDIRPTCETGTHQNPRTEHRLYSLWLWPKQLLARHVSKGKGNKDFIKIKRFCIATKATDNTKRWPTEWKMVFAIDISDKGLVSKIYKELIKLNAQRTNNPVKKWVEEMNRHFSKKDTQMGNRREKNAQHHLASGK